MDDRVYYNNGKYYVVNYDTEELSKFREEVINNASQIVHMDYCGDYSRNPFYRKKAVDPLEVRNFTKEEIGFKEDYNGRKIKQYHYEYDRYLFPYLESLINRLINNDVSTLEEIYKPNYINEYVPEFCAINELEKRLIRVDHNDIDKKIDIIDKIKRVLLYIKANGLEIPVKKYYEELQGMISIEELKMRELL